MENQVNAAPAAYDYRLYDRIWRRVSPELNPYPEIRAEAGKSQTVQAVQSTAPAPAGGGLESLPGADENPCCMGTRAQMSLGVLTGFIEEEAADRRHYLALARRVRSQQASALLRTFAEEKQEAVGRLRAAYFLITGKPYAPAAMVEQLCCRPLADLLREVYHQEACGGYNYERASEEAEDICLTKLFADLSKASYKRSEQVMELLGKMIR